MRNVIMSMPRCGSAWLAAYFGYLHDPLPSDKIVHYSIVDTGASVDPEAAYKRYWADRTVVLVGNESRITRSLQTLGFPVSPELVAEWSSRLYNFAISRHLPVFQYSELLGPEASMEHVQWLCESLGEDYDPLRWRNQSEMRVTHDVLYYTPARYEEYMRWLLAS